MNEIETAILKFGWLPYELGSVVPAMAPYYLNKNTMCKVFRYTGTRTNGQWNIVVKAGIVFENGKEFMARSITWKVKHDDQLKTFAQALNVLFTEDGMSFRIQLQKEDNEVKCLKSFIEHYGLTDKYEIYKDGFFSA